MVLGQDHCYKIMCFEEDDAESNWQLQHNKGQCIYIYIYIYIYLQLIKQILHNNKKNNCLSLPVFFTVSQAATAIFLGLNKSYQEKENVSKFDLSVYYCCSERNQPYWDIRLNLTGLYTTAVLKQTSYIGTYV